MTSKREEQLERALSDLVAAFHPRLPEDKVLIARAEAILERRRGWVKKYVWEGLKDGLARLDAARRQAEVPDGS